MYQKSVMIGCGMSDYITTARTRLGRKPERARYDRATVHSILDEALFCHVAYCAAEGPVCIPMVYARWRDAILLHGSAGNGPLRALRDGTAACVTVTIIDALVFGRSAFRSSVNYRSVVIYGSAEEILDLDEKAEALQAVVEHVMPGRFPDVRAPNEPEMRQTIVLRIPIEEVSAKVRSGFSVDEEPDYARECWAGTLPLALRAGEPEDDHRLLPGLQPPRYVREYVRPSVKPESQSDE